MTIQATPAPTPPKGEGRRVVAGEEKVKGGWGALGTGDSTSVLPEQEV